MFRRIIFAAAISGVLAGLLLSAVQSMRSVPLILLAETYETAAHTLGSGAVPHTHMESGVTHTHSGGAAMHTHNSAAATHSHETAATHMHGPAGGASADLSRTALAAVSNIVAAIAFALLLIAGFVLRGGADWRKGVLWGLGGFAAFSLAPSLGLPPELPGAFAAPVPDRQLWWALTVALTAAGLAVAAFAPGRGWKVLGAALIALPHLIGAPQPIQHGGLAPEALAREFAVAALLASGLFWIALGGLSGYFFNRFEDA